MKLTTKEKRTLKHVINTCLKYKIGFEYYSVDVFQVKHYKDGVFKIHEEFAFNKYGQSIFELREKLDIYIKYNITNE